MASVSAKSATSDSAVLAIAARLERLPTTSYQWGMFFVIATAWLFDSIDLGALTFLLGSIKTELHLTLTEAGLLSSASFAGMFIGAATSGLAADRFGRRRLFQMSMIFWGAGSVLCGLAPTAPTLMLCRVLVGFGMGMEFPVAQAIASEITPAKHRGRYIALLEGCWPLGFILAGLVAYLVLPRYGWRAVFILEGVPALWVLVIRQAIPESPRWLATRGRLEEAEEVMAHIERKVQTAGRLRELPTPEAVTARTFASSWGTSFRELWSGIYLKRTVMIWILWFFALLGYYGLTTWLGALLQNSGYGVTKSVLYTVLISLAGIPGFLVAAAMIEIWGRKPTCVCALLGGAGFCYLYGTAASVSQLIIFGLAMQFCLFGMWSVLYAYTPELYSNRARATGAGFASAIGRVGSLVGPPLVGVILASGGQGAVFASGAACFLVAALAVLLLGEETCGKRLEEISP